MALELMTVSEVARLFALSPDSIRRLARTGELPVERTATGVRIFQRAQVMRALARRKG